MAQNTRKRAASVDAVQMASAEIGHKPPQAPEVEEAVVGAMMLDADSVYMAMESLKEKSFYDPKLRLIFAAMAKLFHERSAIDMMTVTERLRNDGTLLEIGGLAALAGLTQKVGSGANIEYYIKILQQKTIQRDLIEVGYGILRKAFDETYEVDWLIEESQSEVYNAVQGNMRSGYVDLGEAINMAIERLEWVQKTDGLTGVPSGFPALDAITRGWQKGNLIVIGARPGHGKSAIALNMAVAAGVSVHEQPAERELRHARPDSFREDSLQPEVAAGLRKCHTGRENHRDDLPKFLAVRTQHLHRTSLVPETLQAALVHAGTQRGL